MKLTFEQFLVIVNRERDDVLEEARVRKSRGLPAHRIREASEKLKKEFHRVFGVQFSEVKENIDERNWNRNITDLLKGRDVNLANSSGQIKRKRKSANESLNESFLMNFEESASLEQVDELTRLRAENLILRQQVEAMQEVFVKKRVRTPKSRNSGGSVLTYSNKMRALAISLLAEGESAASVHKVLKTMTVITPELLESSEGVVGIPCQQTLSLWRNSLPGLNDVQTELFIESSQKLVLGKFFNSYNRKLITVIQRLMKVKYHRLQF